MITAAKNPVHNTETRNQKREIIPRPPERLDDRQFSRRPSHPGELLREEILPGAQMTQAELAQALRVSRVTVSEAVLEKRGITPDLALRLGQFFGNGPELWLNLQRNIDLWEPLQANRQVYKTIRPLKRPRA
ncbi:MAG TPA: HigA family addiction module antitoxin [Terriglobia bacterium]|nr:HigA family addiction module antitoxin [Terriglobia bacterium]